MRDWGCTVYRVTWLRHAQTVGRAAKDTQGTRTLSQRAMAVPAMLRDALTGRWRGTSRLKLVMALLIPLYVVSPIDLVPDLLLPFGIADDAALLALAVTILLGSADRWLADSDGPPTAAEPASGTVIQGVVVERSDRLDPSSQA